LIIQWVVVKVKAPVDVIHVLHGDIQPRATRPERILRLTNILLRSDVN